MRRKIPSGVKDEALRLRKDERLGAKEIAQQCRVALSTVTRWLKDSPLTAEEITRRIRYGNGKKKGRARKEVLPSPLYSKLGRKDYNNNEKGRIAEAAVLLRLHLLRYDVYYAVLGPSHIDFIVPVGAAKTLVKIQVRWARWEKFGAPVAGTTCSHGRGKFKPIDTREMDIFVGYDVVTDTAYVFTAAEVQQVKKMVSMRDDAAERWDKLEGS